MEDIAEQIKYNQMEILTETENVRNFPFYSVLFQIIYYRFFDLQIILAFAIRTKWVDSTSTNDPAIPNGTI